jgi:hypothetical protein
MSDEPINRECGECGKPYSDAMEDELERLQGELAKVTKDKTGCPECGRVGGSNDCCIREGLARNGDREADAALIARAPDLLQALRDARRTFDVLHDCFTGGHPRDVTSMTEQAMQAIDEALKGLP